MRGWLPRPVLWLSWLLVSCLCFCNLVLGTKRLDCCTIRTDFPIVNSSNETGLELETTSSIPVIYFQTSTRHTDNPVHMNFAWSTVGFPTLFVSQSFGKTSGNCSGFKINETEFLDSQAYGSVNVSSARTNASLAIVFRRLIMFDGGSGAKSSRTFDPSATLQQNNTKYRSVYLNHSIDWTYLPSQRTIVGKSIARNFTSLKFRFQLPSMEEDDRISYFPRTKYTRNSTVFDITLYKFNYTSQDKDMKNGRIALEMVMVNGQPVGKSSTSVSSTEDDEYTPSVFRTWEYDFGSPSHAYLQWKPISYQNHKRKSTASQEANIVFPNKEAITFLDGQVPRSLASALFDDSTPLNGTAMYMVIGTDGDDTYLNTPHLTWTAVVGYGRIPQDTISIEVIIIIIVSLGIPALLIFLGSFYVTYKKKPWQNIARGINRFRRVQGYERLN